MFKNVYQTGFLLAAVILLIYFITLYFFQDVHFYRNSILINAFLLPTLFAVAAIGSVVTYKNFKGNISFREAFGRAFLPIFTAGLISLSVIFVYITYINPETKVLLNHQYIESYQNGLEEEYAKAKSMVRPGSGEAIELEKKYAEGKLRIAAKKDAQEDMFSLRYFLMVFAGYNVFFLLLSLILSSFYRTRSIH